jgi:heat shock protein HslJ
MKTNKLLVIIPFLFLIIGMGGCEEKINVPDLYHTWKLKGFGNTADNSFKEADPKDCEECFVLTFYDDNTFTGKSIINRFVTNYYLSGNNLSFPNGINITKVDEITGDGTKFTEALKNVHRYSIEKSMLKLFYSDTEYLLFYLKS